MTIDGVNNGTFYPEIIEELQDADQSFRPKVKPEPS